MGTHGRLLRNNMENNGKHMRRSCGNHPYFEALIWHFAITGCITWD
jgi:hypothetical protein